MVKKKQGSLHRSMPLCPKRAVLAGPEEHTLPAGHKRDTNITLENNDYCAQISSAPLFFCLCNTNGAALKQNQNVLKMMSAFCSTETVFICCNHPLTNSHLTSMSFADYHVNAN